MGSSAGGHLASTLMTHFDEGNTNSPDIIDQQSSRPDLVVLCYAVISLVDYAHGGSKNALLGTNPPPALLAELSAQLHVTKQTPPCFIFHTYEDKTVPVENSLMLAEALRKAGVPFDLHIYQKGGHGMGVGSHEWNPSKRHPWTADLAFWLKAQGWTK